MATSVTSTHFSQELLQSFHPRKFLLHSSLYPAISPAEGHSYSINETLHTNAAIVLLALVCTIISASGLFRIIKCANRGSSSVSAAEPKLDNAGVEQEALKSFPIVKYTTESKLPGLDTAACVICLSEFTAGERLRILAECNHGFHTSCIDTWLGSHSSCPTCRHSLTETNKINMESMQPMEQ
ncbi:putative RING zinc finger protein [Hibiscus syriacus]|uniref:RING-type E3 ubiquitin transferase n=1 Tax=Hibiscus syriacus TaxID=106335 RepID=A0A6A2WCF0_HIBSY|nr:RING-H2 finger protein ATL78-like [Hibiscus syriacus]KAE8655903.1 putative RING zinc finger protein [Hibiscus syriacus]